MITALAWSSVVLATWVTAGFFVFVVPAVDRPQRADAIVVLAPVVGTGRLELAEELMSDGLGTLLVVSMPDGVHRHNFSEVCRANRSYRIICFDPDPVTTQGEARAIQRLSEEFNWGSITVVTNEFHVARAELIIQRCYSYELNMVAVRSDLALKDWAYQFLYQSASWAKAAISYEC
ncbi:YdcF family protein [Arthrobacter sp. AFG7.2]|uniref:YdcF family protein n=1 Tax=Arthrobacter sp. AFG7.2 TaxID=1688693 RepID=UPI0016703B35|nr:YdcF family protein [Arthrobacter sp. AFG7.2]